MKAKRLKLVLTLSICLVLASNAEATAQGKGKGGGKPGDGGGNTGIEYLIVQLETTDSMGMHDRANDVNDLREVVGRATLPNGDSAAGYWTVVETDGVVQSTLSFLDGGHIATAVNNLGEIVQQTYGPTGDPLGVY
jgi:hypothetical protein